MYSVLKSFSRKKSRSGPALHPRVPRCVSEIHAVRYRFGSAICCRDPSNEKRCCALIVRAESRQGRVNACMRDQAATYESAGESAKQLALQLCGETTRHSPFSGTSTAKSDSGRRRFQAHLQGSYTIADRFASTGSFPARSVTERFLFAITDCLLSLLL